MTPEHDSRARIVLSWLREDAYENAERVLLRALDEVDATPQRRSWWPARRSRNVNQLLKYGLGAAAAVAVAVAGLQLLPGAGVNPPSPTPRPTPEPTARIHQGAGPLGPGRWAMDIGQVRVVFDIPAQGWQENVVPDVIWTSGSEARFSFGFVDNLYADPCDPSAEREPPIGPTVDDLASALASLPGIDATGPTAATLGGFDGQLVEFNVPATGAPCGESGIALWETPVNGQPAPLDAGSRSRFWILDVDGTRLVVAAVEDATTPPGIATQLEQILGSLRIEP